ncbi:hypothetical protein Trichorick_01586 (plasmid) [Candidatus Trichorickettsia mobilis]|uniref:hypothetical protein n=1 Tax=Candidatus Trichorickettsia mobilis TaxID=1346319 RepID=UPI002B263109|nr:hypothetical protein [Candidatus Trichorickettsia mobilis]WPY01668.1 hypothetical protein Trichorick_01586 [Candidatus Trichorickettsia mobilis]
MSDTVTASEEYFLIKIDGKDSTGAPRGQKGAYPIRYIEFPDVGTRVNLSDDSTFSNPRYPLFATLTAEGGGAGIASATLIEELDKILEGLRLKQEPLKVTLMRVVNQTKDGNLDVKQYELDRTVELDKATIHLAMGASDTYQVQAVKAILGTGDKATNKIEIDYLNKT